MVKEAMLAIHKRKEVEEKVDALFCRNYHGVDILTPGAEDDMHTTMTLESFKDGSQ